MEKSAKKRININKKPTKNKGFIVIELLSIIIGLGILIFISWLFLKPVIEKAKASELVADLNQISKAFLIWQTEEGISKWWPENDFLPKCKISSNKPYDGPSITCLIKNFALGNYFPKKNKFNFDFYFYDNDGDVFDIDGDKCKDKSVWAGVSLNVQYHSFFNVRERVDEIIDSGDGPFCGKIVWDPVDKEGYFSYRLANGPSDFSF